MNQRERMEFEGGAIYQKGRKSRDPAEPGFAARCRYLLASARLALHT